MIPNKLIEAVVVFVFMTAAFGHQEELEGELESSVCWTRSWRKRGRRWNLGGFVP
jgi:hypothetical protein